VLTPSPSLSSSLISRRPVPQFFCLLSISLSNCFPPFFPVVNPACSCHDWYLQRAQQETEKGGKGVQNSINQRTVEGGKGGLRTRAEHCLRKPHTIKTHKHHTHTHTELPIICPCPSRCRSCFFRRGHLYSCCSLPALGDGQAEKEARPDYVLLCYFLFFYFCGSVEGWSLNMRMFV